ncbi:MAG: methyltransferase [Myxococcaceae bacterium]|nr:methyltransferase [Myxococcaceae bacterium]
MKLFLACAPGLEGVLEAEVRERGLTGHAVPGGVEAEGPPDAYEDANLWLRCATRVWVRIAEVGRPEELSRVSLGAYKAKAIPIALDCPPRWQSMAERSWGKSSSHGLEVMLREDEHGRCQISVDSSGELLHVRGYRQEIGKAPLRETLAAGVLRLGGYRGDAPLWDVMCGSGTLLIEAAWIAMGKAPGALRHFAFESWPSHDLKRWEARPRVLAAPAPLPLLLGTDLNSGQLGIARRNAKRAFAFEAIKLERMDATKLPARPGPPGLVVGNLPYGIRVGERSELGDLYAALGASLKQAVPGWRFAFLLQEGEAALGLSFEQVHDVNNGGIRCRVVTGEIR